MAAGRKQQPAPEAHPIVADAGRLRAAGDALSVVSQRSAEVAQRFGDGTPYERGRVVAEARFYMAQSAEAMLELGKRLIQLKENEPHGDFLEIVTDRLGMSVRTAQVSMQAAVKYLAVGAKAQAPALLQLGKAKLLDLLAEPDDSIEALADGGTVAGLTLDDMQAMTSRELRAALVEARQSIAAKDKVIAKKDQKLNKLAEEAELRSAIGSDEAATLAGLRDATASAEIALAQLAAAVGSALDGAPNEAVQTAARQAAEYIAQRLADLINQHGIAVQFDELVQPVFLGSPAPAKGRKG